MILFQILGGILDTNLSCSFCCLGFLLGFVPAKESDWLWQQNPRHSNHCPHHHAGCPLSSTFKKRLKILLPHRHTDQRVNNARRPIGSLSGWATPRECLRISIRSCIVTISLVSGGIMINLVGISGIPTTNDMRPFVYNHVIHVSEETDHE